jgi:hypothetical protein
MSEEPHPSPGVRVASTSPEHSSPPRIHPDTSRSDALTSPSPSSNTDEYDGSLKPEQFTCPFAHRSRTNPCVTLTGTSKTKTQVRNHLMTVRRKGYDKHHPKDDPLWNEPLVKNYYLLARPVLSEDESRRLRQLRNQKGYQKRKEREEGAEEKYRQGLIGEKEYRRLLVGKRRLDFDLEKAIAETKAQIQQIHQEALEKIEAAVEARIRNLRQSGGSSESPEQGD